MLSDFQISDPETGLIMPWLTHGALNAMRQMDLSDKVIWMWGAGMGDTWLAKRCSTLYVVERNNDWLNKSSKIATENNVTNIIYIHRPCNEGSGAEDYYCYITDMVRPDVFIVDDAYRYECILKAMEYKPCILIVDNWQQDYVFICPAAQDLMKDYEGQFFVQSDHTNHEGRPWTTAIWHLK